MSRANARKYMFYAYKWGENMNLCILYGTIVSDIEFKFIIKGKNKSIAYFDMELLNTNVIRVKAYNEMADFIYRKLLKGQSVIVEGKIRNDGNIECENFILPRKDSIFKTYEL